MDQITHIRALLRDAASIPEQQSKMFYKTGTGDYAQHDSLINSAFNEENLLNLFILIRRYQKANANDQQEIYEFYMDNIKYINNWNLVDSSAHLILDMHLMDKDKEACELTPHHP